MNSTKEIEPVEPVELVEKFQIDLVQNAKEFSLLQQEKKHIVETADVIILERIALPVEPNTEKAQIPAVELRDLEEGDRDFPMKARVYVGAGFSRDREIICVPVYLSGAIRKELVGVEGFGYMRTPFIGNKADTDTPWMADTGCYSQKVEKEFVLDKYLGWLKVQPKLSCLGATAPDKVGDAKETEMRSLPVLPLIREIGYKAAFVAQDGIEDRDVPWNEFDVLFIGGTTNWKLSTVVVELCSQARSRRKWVHMGRVNSFKRYLFAAQLGCNSVDGTFLCFGANKNLPRLFKWKQQLQLRKSQCSI